MRLARELATYAFVGVFATLVHYAILIALVEGFGWRAVPATLVGYVAGGVLSYILNRRHTFASDRPHAEATWRFALVAFIGFCVTCMLMFLFVEKFGAPYLPVQIVTTVLVMCITFFVNRNWTFGDG